VGRSAVGFTLWGWRGAVTDQQAKGRHSRPDLILRARVNSAGRNTRLKTSPGLAVVYPRRNATTSMVIEQWHSESGGS
jgi:hypothetical protein